MRLVGIVAGALVAGGLASACDTEESNGGGTGGAAAATFDASECGQCVAQACTGEAQACAGDPGCAAYLSCLHQCPLDVLGNVDGDCEATCPIPASSTAVELVSDYTFCRLDGGGVACATCGFANILGQQCPASPETNECWKCEEERCCDTYNACKDDPACSQIAPCMQTCAQTDTACEENCILTHAAGMHLFGPRMTCIYAQCPAGNECGPIDSCSACISEQCSNSHQACYSNGECFLLEGCVGGCEGDATCVDTCMVTYAGGVAEFNLYAICALQKCELSC
jgi:hypothetical protein